MSVDVNRLVRYRSPIFDNHRWAGFVPRASDIFVCTPPKCGTTWTQTIVASLLWPDGNFPGPVMNISPWIDAHFMPVEAMREMLQGQSHRRFMKTHTPADGIPWFDEAKYIFVARDGRDAFMSMCNHRSRMRPEFTDVLNKKALADGVPPMPPWDGDVHGFFKEWLADGGAAGMGHFSMVASYWNRRGQSNLLLVHYNDLKADLSAEMQRIARFLEIQIPQQLWQGAVQRCTFESMREDSARVGTFDGFEGGTKGFIFQGTNGRWRDVLTADELATYTSKVGERLSNAAAAWMSQGRSALRDAAHS